jgi:HD-GYP domain-containing protein (c-di-GMP phosphodiesterase class II)
MDIRLSEVISALSYALDVTEGQPMVHAVRSCAIGMRIGEEIGLAPAERSELFYALLLKDAGCSSNAARLSTLRVGAFRDLAATAGAHHERLDGGGYHLGLTGDQLNRDARILAVADVCEALTAERPYRAALPPDEVRAIMRRDAGRALCSEALGALEASQELGVLACATPASPAARPAAR